MIIPKYLNYYDLQLIVRYFPFLSENRLKKNVLSFCKTGLLTSEAHTVQRVLEIHGYAKADIYSGNFSIAVWWQDREVGLPSFCLPHLRGGSKKAHVHEAYFGAYFRAYFLQSPFLQEKFVPLGDAWASQSQQVPFSALRCHRVLQGSNPTCRQQLFMEVTAFFIEINNKCEFFF